jgi:hypothetical protein
MPPRCLQKNKKIKLLQAKRMRAPVECRLADFGIAGVCVCVPLLVYETLSY